MMYKPCNILVTGGAGFIGSHFVNLILAKYPAYKVVVYDKMDYCASKLNLITTSSGQLSLVEGDICDYAKVLDALETHNIDTVVHFAAQSHVDSSFGNSLSFTMNNTYGSHVLLEAVRVYGKVARFVNVSTDEVYGETSLGKAEGLVEHSVLEPTNPYASSKAAAEMVCTAYINSYKMPIIITRGNNVYGNAQHIEKLIPKVITSILEEQDIQVHGDGGALRSYLHVSDVARAFDVIMHRGTLGETYNIGTSTERSVVSVVYDLIKILKYDSARITHVQDRPFQDRRYFVASDKLGALGWKEQVSWEDGLKSTIEWYKSRDWKTYWNRDGDPAPST
jgi:dTDP-glucose 4,6-dehydratase